MVGRSKGFRSNTRNKLKKGYHKSGIGKFLRKFEINQKVLIKLEPSSHKGMPHPRFHGRVGVVIGTRGRAYIVQVRDGNSYKKLIVNPEHLTPVTKQ